MGSLLTEVNRIAKDTTYGGAKVLYGDTADSLYKPAGTPQDAGKGNGEITFQVGANSGDTITMTVENYSFSKIMEGITNHADNYKKDDLTGAGAKQTAMLNFFKDEVTIILTGAGNNGTPSDLIQIMDKAIAKVDGTRANLGALQNRLESSIRNQSNTSANEADARSRIRDADFAEESANLSQQSIIQQAATSMLMQANTRPQLGLSLLG